MVVEIYVVFPDVKANRLKAGLNAKIDDILEKIGRQYVLIHDGVELLPQFTVGFYRLQQGDRIWAVPKNDPASIKRYSLQNCTLDYILKRFVLKDGYDKEMETVRKDIRNSKYDADPKKSRKIIRKYEAWADTVDYKPLEITETIYFKPTKPCSEPIPPFLLFCGVRF